MKVLINGIEDTLTYVYSNGGGDCQYNTSENRSAFTFRGRGPEVWPKDTPIKTSGCIIIVLSGKKYTYHRPPTDSEIKFGHGATHYRDFELKDVIDKKGNKKKWFVADDGLRYYL
jgi:hypothetical protein